MVGREGRPKKWGWVEGPRLNRVSKAVGMSNRSRRRPLYVRPGDDVVIVWTRRQTGFTKFPLDWLSGWKHEENKGENRRPGKN
jgi:hypothetical protein